MRLLLKKKRRLLLKKKMRLLLKKLVIPLTKKSGEAASLDLILDIPLISNLLNWAEAKC